LLSTLIKDPCHRKTALIQSDSCYSKLACRVGINQIRNKSNSMNLLMNAVDEVALEGGKKRTRAWDFIHEKQVDEKTYGVFVNPRMTPPNPIHALKTQSKARLQLIHWLSTEKQTTSSREQYNASRSQQDRLQRFIDFPPLPEDDPFYFPAFEDSTGDGISSPMSHSGGRRHTHNGGPQRTPRTCVRCYNSKVKCDRNTPCQRCLRIGMECVPRVPQRRMRVDPVASSSSVADGASARASSPKRPNPPQSDDSVRFDVPRPVAARPMFSQAQPQAPQAQVTSQVLPQLQGSIQSMAEV
jgi:hypothetical protein